jgi:hypothetical protein
VELFGGLSAFPLTPTNAARHLQADVLCRFLERISAAKTALPSGRTAFPRDLISRKLLFSRHRLYLVSPLPSS